MEQGNLDIKEFNELLCLEYKLKHDVLSEDKVKDTKRLKALKAKQKK